MGKPKKSRKNRFNYNKDRRKTWKKSKKLPSIPCKPIKRAWDESKSAVQNLLDMGLSADPNKSLSITKAKAFTHDVEGTPKWKHSKATKSHVAEELEQEANQPHISTMKLSDPMVQYCVYMMNKYGEDYKAMARDPKNYYQDTPKQIRRKILTFKNTPTQYKAYVASLEGCVTPVKVGDTAKKCIVPRRRMPTRGFEAALRNGHFPSLSPVTVTQPAPRKVDESLLAALVRVRRRLRFGRKPPKERSIVTQTDVLQDIREKKPSEYNVSEDERRVSTATPPCDKDDDGVNPRSTSRPTGLCAALNKLGDHSGKCSSDCSQTRRSRKKLDMSDSGSIIKLESPLPQRET
ncbi:uncharacterized protein LOC135467653 [Liolophura sinensis]|uniref:uncharacterized protein LOC135467653 n=1 Tax=Liolophura sinensis TaxID=3198878 RepID=UPI003158555E